MKKGFILLLVLVMLVSLVGCGKSKDVVAVEELISSIGSITIDSEETITSAQESYDLLNDKQKEQVENYSVLEEARISLQKIKDEIAEKEAEEAKKAEAQAKIDAVFDSSWTKDAYVDNFGDPTDQYYMKGTFEGTFSNSATTDSDLLVYMFCKTGYYASDETFSFRLVEYGDHIAQIYEDDKVTVSVKINGNVFTDKADFIYDNDIHISMRNDIFFEVLKNLDAGKSIPCYIEVQSSFGNTSRYNFTIKANGLSTIDHFWPI